MNGFTCLKPCTLMGVAYSKGDAIPLQSVLPERAKPLIKQGLIAQADYTEAITLTVPVKIKGEKANAVVSVEDLVAAMDILLMNADDAVKAVRQTQNKDVLLLVDSLDHRKTVKTEIPKG